MNQFNIEKIFKFSHEYKKKKIIGLNQPILTISILKIISKVPVENQGIYYIYKKIHNTMKINIETH